MPTKIMSKRRIILISLPEPWEVLDSEATSMMASGSVDSGVGLSSSSRLTSSTGSLICSPLVTCGDSSLIISPKLDSLSGPPLVMNLGGVGVAGLESMGSVVVFSATSSSELVTTASRSGGVGAEKEGRFFLVSSGLGMTSFRKELQIR